MPADFDLYIGYLEDFLDPNQRIDFPQLNKQQLEDVAPVDGTDDNILHYVNYSLQLSSSRRFPYYTASNIDGKLFKKAPRKDSWRRDERIDANFQWGPELYRADMSDFDKGHMTKREDVQWGDSIAFASLAADSTFYYTNAVPQHGRLNQRIWRSLEDYILHTEAKDNDLRICVFTGPVLSNNDPWFVTEVKGENLRIPTLFWKIVMFRRSDGKIYRVGFLMSQETLLLENGIAEQREEAVEDELFMKFKDADTYQVNVRTIERLTGLTFAKGIEPFTDDRSIKLILDEVDVRESLNESADVYAQIGFKIIGLQI
jgi:endonuclease G